MGCGRKKSRKSSQKSVKAAQRSGRFNSYTSSGEMMTACVKKNLRKLAINIDQHTAEVERKLAKGDNGELLNPSVVVSAAKYYTTLKELADE